MPKTNPWISALVAPEIGPAKRSCPRCEGTDMEDADLVVCAECFSEICEDRIKYLPESKL